MCVCVSYISPLTNIFCALPLLLPYAIFLPVPSLFPLSHLTASPLSLFTHHSSNSQYKTSYKDYKSLVRLLTNLWGKKKKKKNSPLKFLNNSACKEHHSFVSLTFSTKLVVSCLVKIFKSLSNLFKVTLSVKKKESLNLDLNFHS